MDKFEEELAAFREKCLNPNYSEDDVKLIDQTIALILEKERAAKRDAIIDNIIPKSKIGGLRLGQIIANVARRQGIPDEDVHSWLFYIENKDLAQRIKKFFEEY